MVGERPIDVHYRLRPDHVAASVDGVELSDVIVHACTPNLVDLQVAGVRRTVAVARRGQTRFADSTLGSTMFSERIRFPEPSAHSAPGSLVAPMPGTVIRVETARGQIVEAGDIVVVLEAMKMEHPVKAPHTGTVVELDAKPGQAVELGTVLAVVSQEPAA
jgi:biotin carboxyl carrier protein